MPLLYFQNHLKKNHQIFKKDTFLVALLRITLKKKKCWSKTQSYRPFFFFFFSSSSSSLMGSYTPFSPNWWNPQKNLSNLLIYFVFINYQVTHLTLFGKNSRSIYVWEFCSQWNIWKKFHLGVILFCCHH